MVSYMKCIKTGCDIICDGMIFHGDLFFKNDVLILSGVPNESWSSVNNSVHCLKAEGKKVFYHFQASSLSQIPTSGNFSCFMVEGVFDIQEDFLNQIKFYEKPDCVEFFQGV